MYFIILPWFYELLVPIGKKLDDKQKYNLKGCNKGEIQFEKFKQNNNVQNLLLDCLQNKFKNILPSLILKWKTISLKGFKENIEKTLARLQYTVPILYTKHDRILPLQNGFKRVITILRSIL